MINKVKKLFYTKASTRNIIFIFILSQIIFALMTFYTFPIIQLNSPGISAPDLSPMGYSYEHIMNFLENLSPESRDMYLYVQEPLDVLYPFLQGTFFVLFFIRFYNKKSNLVFLGFIPMVFDYLENIFVTVSVFTLNPSELWVQISSLFTIIKSISNTICYFVVLALIIKKVYNIFQKRGNIN